MVTSEDDFRLVPWDEIGTPRSSASAKKRKKDRKKVTPSYRHQEIVVGPICTCRSFRYPHELSAHASLRGEMDWRTPQQRGE